VSRKKAKRIQACEIFKSAENPGETVGVSSAAGAGISEVILAVGGREYTCFSNFDLVSVFV